MTSDNASTVAVRGGLLSAIAVSCALAGSACDSSSAPAASVIAAVSGTVVTSWGAAVSGATVYLVPAAQIDETPITSADVLSGKADAYDEPLEDLVRSAAAQDFPQATTDSGGGFQIPGVDTTGSYFPFVAVASATPADLYPGGNLSRVALSGAALDRLDIEVTGHPPSTASYVGSSTCLICHSGFSSQKVHAHRLGFRKPGITTALQDLSRKPDFDDGLAFFKDATASNFKTNGTTLWYHGYDGNRGFDKFIVAQSDPGSGVQIKVYLWKDTADGRYKITMENALKTTDPDRTFVVDLTYGGALFKQRYMLQIAGAAFEGRYPFLQYQHAGDDSYYDRTRKVWRDYHMDFFWDATAQEFKDPDKTSNIEGNCMACHSTGYRYFTNMTTSERMCDAVDDPAGAFDIDSDGTPDEINTGCEVCHGPGSEHITAKTPQFIVNPEYLSPSRESQICGRCHDQVAGNDDRKNEQPVNAAGEMAQPGTSRNDFLNDYTSRKGPAPSAFWNDQFHSKSHQQQYSDFIKSKHYRNSRRLVVCSDCHDLHGKGAFAGELRGDPRDGTLCATCHPIADVSEHVFEEVGSRKTGQSTSCISCHYYKTAKSGAGRRGILLGPPTGGASDAEITYWENDISSHHTVIPRKANVGVRGQTPGEAMPVPYVNACGVCHDARFLKFQK